MTKFSEKFTFVFKTFGAKSLFCVLLYIMSDMEQMPEDNVAERVKETDAESVDDSRKQQKAKANKNVLLREIQLRRQRRDTCTELFGLLSAIDECDDNMMALARLHERLENLYCDHNGICDQLAELYLKRDAVASFETLQNQIDEMDSKITMYRSTILKKEKSTQHEITKKPIKQENSIDNVSHAASNSSEHIDPQHEIIAMLARSTLPECEPDKFHDDKTQYYAWKSQMFSFIFSKLTKASDKLVYTERYTSEKSLARSVVAAYVKQGTQLAFESAWKRLDQVFGNPTYVCKAHMDKIREFQPIEVDETEKLLEFSSILNIMLTDMNSVEKAYLLNSDENIRVVLIKLPIEIIKSWEYHCRKKLDDELIEFAEVTAFIEQEALSRSNPKYGRDDIIKEKIALSKSTEKSAPGSGPATRSQGQSRIQRTLATRAIPSDEMNNKKSCCQFCNKPNHPLYDCFKIKTFDTGFKRSFFIAHNVCTVCGAHRNSNDNHKCKDDIVCRTCQGPHLTAFHKNHGNTEPDRRKNARSSSPSSPELSEEEQQNAPPTKTTKSQTVIKLLMKTKIGLILCLLRFILRRNLMKSSPFTHV